MLQLVQEQSSDKEQESLSCITEHGSENKGVGDGNKPGRVHLAIGGKSVQFLHTFQRGLKSFGFFSLGSVADGSGRAPAYWYLLRLPGRRVFSSEMISA